MMSFRVFQRNIVSNQHQHFVFPCAGCFRGRLKTSNPFSDDLQTYLIKNGGYSAKSPRKWRANSIA